MAWCTLSLALHPAYKTLAIPQKTQTMVENHVPAQLEDFVSMKSVFIADITDVQAFEPCIPTVALYRPDWLPHKKC